MNNINNIYNFQNYVRFFFDIDDFYKKYRENFYYQHEKLQKVSIWEKPLVFNIKKNDGELRNIKIPHILSFCQGICIMENRIKESNELLVDIVKKDRSRMSTNLKLGEFKKGNYSECIDEDLHLLTKYDVMLKFDICSFYNSIYTHDIVKKELFTKEDAEVLDQVLSSFNTGRTHSLIMGNFLSLVIGEKFLAKVSKEIIDKISNDLNLSYDDEEKDFEIRYFSDNILIFCHYDNKVQIKNVLHDNNFLEFKIRFENEYNYLEWKCGNKLNFYISKIFGHLVSGNNTKNKNDFDFMKTWNEIMYRMSKLKTLREQRILLLNFFRNDIFLKELGKNVDDVYEKIKSDLKYCIKIAPEILLFLTYTDELINELSSKNDLEMYCINLLLKNFSSKLHDNQLYIFYFLYNMKWHKNPLYNRNHKFSKKNLLTSAYKNKNYILFAYMIECYDVDITYVIEEFPGCYSYLTNKIAKNSEKFLNSEEFFSDKKTSKNTRELRKKSSDFLREYCHKQEKLSLLLPLKDVRKNIINYINERSKEE